MPQKRGFELHILVLAAAGLVYITACSGDHHLVSHSVPNSEYTVTTSDHIAWGYVMITVM